MNWWTQNQSRRVSSGVLLTSIMRLVIQTTHLDCGHRIAWCIESLCQLLRLPFPWRSLRRTVSAASLTSVSALYGATPSFHPQSFSNRKLTQVTTFAVNRTFLSRLPGTVSRHLRWTSRDSQNSSVTCFLILSCFYL